MRTLVVKSACVDVSESASQFHRMEHHVLFNGTPDILWLLLLYASFGIDMSKASILDTQDIRLLDTSVKDKRSNLCNGVDFVLRKMLLKNLEAFKGRNASKDYRTLLG